MRALASHASSAMTAETTSVDAREHVVLERPRRRDDPVARRDAPAPAPGDRSTRPPGRGGSSAPNPPVSVPSSAVTSAPSSRPTRAPHRAPSGRAGTARRPRRRSRARGRARGCVENGTGPPVRDHRRRALREIGRGEGEGGWLAVGLAHRELADVTGLGSADRSAVEKLVLDEEHRPLVVHRRSEQSAHVGTRSPRRRRCSGSRGGASLATGYGRPVAAPRAHRCADDERNVTWSSYISRNFEIPFTTWSSPNATKSPNMISRIGRRPRSAMPAATPKSEASLIGVEDAVRIRVAQPRRDLESTAARIEYVLAEEDDVARGEDRVQRLART